MTGYYVILMVVLIFFSAYFSATETAFSSLNKTRLKTLCEKGNRQKRAKLAYSLSEQYDRLITAILIGNNIVNIAGASVGTVLFVSLLGDIGATVSTAVVTVAVLIFGEVTPKSIAKDCPEKFAMFAAPFMKVLMVLFTPATVLFSYWKKAVSKILRLEPDDKMSHEELLTLVDEVQQNGSIDKEESELLHNAIEFTDCTAGDILTHRVDLEGVPDTATKEEIADKFTKSRYSRLLVYKDSIDHIIGVIHHKDLYSGAGITKKSLAGIMTPPVYVTKESSIVDILHEMQEKKVHISVVIDEYGGTVGIVTMEDILEELVGDIWDEHDEVTETFKKLNNTTYRVSANAALDEFFGFFGISDENESNTLNSWIVKKLDKVPHQGDSFEYQGINVTVTATARHRTTFLEVTVKDQQKEAGGIKS